jgi:hypothetical protein
LVSGTYTREIMKECTTIAHRYASGVADIMDRRDALAKALEQAEAEVNASRNHPDVSYEAWFETAFRRTQARAAVAINKKRMPQDFKTLIDELYAWGRGKNGNSSAYLAALNTIVCRSKTKRSKKQNDKEHDKETEKEMPSTGSILFYAFGDKMAEAWAEATGGRPVSVDFHNISDGPVEVDPEGRIFSIDRFTDTDGNQYDRKIFIAQVTDEGEVLMDRDGRGPVVVRKVRPFQFDPGPSEVRQNGRLVFLAKQRPFVTPRKSKLVSDSPH